MFKGKVKSVYKILIFMLAIVTAIVCVAFSFRRDNPAYAVINYDHNEFSAVDEDTGAILSVEKVYAISTDDFELSDGLSNDSEFKNTLYANVDATEELSSMFVQGNDKYYYSNIAENGASKYVVRNGDFVMLNNQVTNGTYYTSAFSSYRVESETQTVSQQNMQEAIMVSFGQYYFTDRVNNEFAIAGENEGAGIQTINVVARRNGEIISLPSPRNYASNTYEDFVCIIPQSQGNEGHYEFTFTYFYGGISYTQTFSFYVLFNTSYNSSYQSSTNNTYSTVPTLENAGDGDNNVYTYSVGRYNQNLNYPTLTFDYTKYDLSYTHTANGVVTTYDYDFVTNTTAGSTSGRMIETVTSFGESTTKTYYLDNYNSLSNGLNFVTFLFTEVGNYNFNFDYIYAGYNSENMPEMNLTIPNIELVISGFEMKYTLTGKQEAGFRYLTISGGDNVADPVDVIVPNGYVRDQVPSNSVVGVIYSLDNNSDYKVGTVVSSEDPSLNSRIEASELRQTLINSQVIVQNGYVFNCLVENIGTPNQHIQTILNYMRDNNFYVKTNQGSIWATSNDNFNSSGSFYYYSTQPIVVTGNEADGYSISGTRYDYLNTTTFTRAGYYLLFISVDVNGGGVDYNQIFAFQYTTDTININANIVEDRIGSEVVAPIGSGQFTNKYVQVSWQEPGVFERRITANYYSVANQYLTRNELLSTAPNLLSNGQVLGTNLGDSEGATYLIELLSEGRSASYHIFTIDRTPIQEIGAYAVERVSTSNNAVSYEFMSINGNYVRLSNSITSSLATLFWADKASGANITATYTFTPFVRDSSITVGEIYSSSSAVWYNTNYRLGTTVGSFDIDKATTLGNEVTYANVLYRQGIYVFTLVDDAGNSAKFMFIIDNTETFFKLTSGAESTFETASSQLFSESVTVELGTHKAMQLDLSETDDDVNSIITMLTSNSNNSAFADIGYYVQADTNINALKSIFGSVQGSYYLTVRNNSLTSRDSENQTDNNTSISNISINNRQTIIDYVEDGSTSTIRTLYLIGENQRYTSTDVTNSNSYIVIEINVDNSRGTFYYSNTAIDGSQIPSDGNIVAGSGIYRLYSGSDVYNTDSSIQIIGIDGAHATSENYLAFVWNMGTGRYQVNSVTYDYYALNLSDDEDSYNNGTNGWVIEDGIVKNVYYYNHIRTTTLYSDGTAQNEGEILNDDRGFALLNVENSRTLEGLYVIRRVYQNTDEDLGSDSLVQTYYVIVDRNGIIDQNNEHIGGYINLGLKEDETDFSEFNTINTQTEYFSYSEGSQTIYQNKAYSLYLTSDKLPITLNIPIAKYFGGNENFGSTYYAGRLSFEFYFRDTQNQLGENRGNVVKLFEITDNDFDASNYHNGIYSVDLRGYLTNSGRLNQDIERIVRSMNETNWICLPGDYIVVIKDMVESAGSTGSHEKVIGFRIEQSEVEADVYSVPNRDMTTEEAQNVASNISENEYRLVTSEEFVKLDMADYIEESTMAGLDLNYLVVTQNLNGYTTNYINHQYQNINGTYRLDDSNPTVVENVYDGSSNLVSRVIYLNTYLRDSNGNINLDNITQSLSYEITIRFRLADTNVTNNERFINCYYYYDNQGNLQTYYEAKITVIIDRVAPTDNINNLLENDALVDYYIEDNGEDMFESSYIETNSNVYFVNRYKTYYGTGDNSNIYAFRVERSTEFDNSDITRLYYRSISDISTVSLTLPAITNLSRYQEADRIFDIVNYEGLLSDTSGYYEILEMDEAGNTTQYVIFYDAVGEDVTSTPNDDLILEFKLTRFDEDGNITEEDVVIDSENNGDSYTIFDIDLAESYDEGNVFTDDFYDRYYRISLISNNPYSETYILTNATTSFSNNGLMNDIVNLIQTAGEGNYILRVETRTESYQVYINYYDYNNRISLNIENLVEVVNGNYQINLQGANVLNEGIMYYASTIEITHNGETSVYICIPTNGNYYYYLNGDVSNGVTQVLTGLSGTYQIRMTDAFGEVYTYRFNTTGEDFYSISFGENGDANFYEFSNTYYAFDQVNINFDSSIFRVRVSRVINDSGISESFTFSSTNNSWLYMETEIARLDGTGNTLYLYPYFNPITYQGAKISYTVEFVLADDTVEYTYYVVLDTRIGAVNLTTNNLAQSMTINVNSDYHTTISDYITSGTSNLSWNRTTSDILSYSYTLYELKSNGEYVSTDLNSQTSYVISTASDSEGIYKFVIEVLSPTGQVLGNKIFTFQVLQNSSELYYVTLPDNSVAEVNSFFKFEEINSYLTTERLNQLGLTNANELTRANVDLYVYNTNLNIQIATDKGVSLASVVIPLGDSNYQFTIYRAYTDTYSLYFATLIVANNTDFISSVAITQNSNTETLAINSRFSFTYVGASTDNFSLRVTPNIPSNLLNNVIVAKNSLVLDLYLNDEFVSTINLNNNNLVGTARLLGNGRYTIVFKDLAGNVHTFTTSLGSQQASLDITILKEPVTTVNDMAPIDNAYYNGVVVVSVYNPATYDIGSIDLTATRNGEAYTPIKSQYNYTFLEYGTYRVVVTASYTDANAVTHNLRKVIVFTIINPNEARESIDLTSLGGFEIVSVLHGDRDITRIFNEMFNQNTSGRLLTYNMLLDYQEELNISSGKQVFTITYRVVDEIYPAREVNFSFTMNNEIPNIYCSLESGETTTSGFTISFNPGIIYEQVGEALIYVNDSLIYSINENSPLAVLSLEITEAQYGAGDYYVRLETASGQVITSFKAVIREPLNAWAIVIIVVVSVIVVAIIVTIILLRRKMRIR